MAFASSGTHIHQFTLDQLGPDRWRATAKHQITPFMAERGCQRELTGSLDDLERACLVQRVMATLHSAAEAQAQA